MGTISSGVGLVSGINYTNLITALTANNQGQISILQAEVTTAQNQQTGLNSLSANLLSLSTSAQTLGNKSTYGAQAVNNSDTSQLNVTLGTGAVNGNYGFTALQQAQTQQVASQGFSNATTQTLGTGTITIAPGGSVDSKTLLSQLNNGAGVQAGSIQITDRSGKTATINLSAATTIDDVVADINKNSQISVNASIQGNHLVLTDTSGSTAGNLTVSDVDGNHVAEDLGIDNSLASSTLTGNDVYQVTGDFQLSQINDGNSISTTTGQPTIQISLTDPGSTKVDVNLNGAVTLNDVVNDINNSQSNNGKVSASIANGRLVLTDLTGGGGTGALTVTDIDGGSATAQLGLNATASGNVLTGNSLGADMNSVLLRNLNGGQGITQLGQITLTDRTGTTATVDLSGAQSLDQVIDAINGATSSGGTKLQLTASVNAAGNGIRINDTSGSTASNLVIADDAGSTAATQLGIAVNAAQNSVNSGSLNLQYVNGATSLSSFAVGGTVVPGSFAIVDSNGGESIVNVTSNITTVGQLIQQINNASGANVTAQLNNTGDGIELIDHAGGTQQLQVEEVGGGATASNLRLLGTGTTGAGGQSTLSAREATVINVTSSDTLNSIVTKINAANSGMTASVINNGGSITPMQLSLQANASGAAAAELVDSSGLGLNFSTLVQGQNAVLNVGTSPASGYNLTSSTNQFNNAVTGLNVTVQKVDGQTAQVSVTQDVSQISTALQNFVSAFNTLASTENTQTAYDASTNTTGALEGDPIVFQLQSALSTVINGSYGGQSGTISSLADLGITFDGNGNLQLDQTTLNNVLTNNPSAVANFFQTATTGFAAQLSNVITRFTDKTNGQLTIEANEKQDTINNLNDRITALQNMLATEKTNLTNQFANLESTLSSLNQQQAIVNQVLAGQSSTSSATNTAASTPLATGTASNNLGNISGSSGNSGSSSSG